MRVNEDVMGTRTVEAASNIGDKILLTGQASIEATESGGEGKLATFDAVAYTGASMRIKGWRYPVTLDLNGHRQDEQQIPALRAHDDDRVVGHSDEITTDSSGVRVKGTISGVGADAKEVVANSKNGFKWQISLGSDPSPGSVEHLAAGKKAVVNGREITGPHSVVRVWSSSEVSFVPRGADNKTSAAIAAQFQGEQDMEFKEWLAGKGIEAAAITEEMKPLLQAAYDAEHGEKKVEAEVATVTNPLDIKAMIEDATKQAVASATEEMKSITAEKDRRAEVARICASHPELAAKADSESWSTDKAELEVIRASRSRPAFISSNADDGPAATDVIEAALCINAGMQEEDMDGLYSEDAIEAGLSSRMRGFGLQALCYETIRAAGRSATPGVFNDSTIRAAFEADRQIKASGASLYSLSGVLSNIANKMVVAGFNSVESAWERIAAVGTTKDFKQTTSYRLTGDFSYEQVGKDGKLKPASMGEESYTNQADTFGKIFTVDRKTLINDDLKSIQSTARLKIGRGAALKINDVFWTEFMDNSTFFAAGNSNYLTGAATALSIDSLTAGEAAFYDLEDPDGDPINLEASLMLVPNGIATLGSQLMRDTEVRDTTANKKGTTGNPHAGKFEVVRSAYLNKTKYTGNSPVAWYLLADPNALGIGVIEIVFLNGQRRPVVESADADFDTLGIKMRGYHDFGVNKQEYRAGVKMKGEA